MFKYLLKLIDSSLCKKLMSRLINRYTGSGVVIVLMQLENIGLLPSGVANAVEGLPAKEILIYVALSVGIYLIIHKPNFRSKLERRKDELEILKIEIELEKAKKELEKRKINKISNRVKR